MPWQRRRSVCSTRRRSRSDRARPARHHGRHRPSPCTAVADKSYIGAGPGVITPARAPKGRNLIPALEIYDRRHAAGERGFSTLQTWRILYKGRCTWPRSELWHEQSSRLPWRHRPPSGCGLTDRASEHGRPWLRPRAPVPSQYARWAGHRGAQAQCPAADGPDAIRTCQQGAARPAPRTPRGAAACGPNPVAARRIRPPRAPATRKPRLSAPSHQDLAGDHRLQHVRVGVAPAERSTAWWLNLSRPRT